jgi:hypothetical protein
VCSFLANIARRGRRILRRGGYEESRNRRMKM